MRRASPSLVLFRLEASERIGVGHLMRCLVLARALSNAGRQTRFVLRGLPETFAPLLDGYQVSSLDGPDTETEDGEQVAALVERFGAAWVVVDHYRLGARWESILRARSLPRRPLRVLAIDDLGRPHDCDLLLDQNYYRDPVGRYRGKVASKTRLLLGPGYALLRQQFLEASKRAAVRTGKVKTLLVSFGGSDPTNETEKVLEALSRLQTIDFDVTVLKKSERLSHAEKGFAGCLPSVRVVDWVEHMAQLMLASDLSFGAGGSTAWERCLMGLPASIVIAAPNQQESMEDLSKFGAVRVLGDADDVHADDWQREIELLLREPETVRATSRRALELMQGQGPLGPRAVVAAMEEAS